MQYALWIGGAHEPMVSIIPNCLCKCLGCSCLQLPQLQTILAEADAILNTQALLYVSHPTCPSLSTDDFSRLKGNGGGPTLGQDDDDPDYSIIISFRCGRKVSASCGNHGTMTTQPVSMCKIAHLQAFLLLLTAIHLSTMSFFSRRPHCTVYGRWGGLFLALQIVMVLCGTLTTVVHMLSCTVSYRPISHLHPWESYVLGSVAPRYSSFSFSQHFL